MNALPGFDRWLEAPYQAQYEAEDFRTRACEEFWDDCATAHAIGNVEYILDREDTAELIQRVAGFAWAKASDDTKRGWADELLEIIRAYCVQNESAINAKCIERAEQYRREARDLMRGGE